MPYTTGTWGEQAKKRSKKRLEYFKSRYYLEKQPDTRIGTLGELLAVQILEGSKLDLKSTHDLLWQGKKIEVKTSAKKQNDKRNDYNFWVSKKQLENADYFLLVCLNETRVVMAIYFLPNKAITKQGFLVSDSLKNKYNKYRIEVKLNVRY